MAAPNKSAFQDSTMAINESIKSPLIKGYPWELIQRITLMEIMPIHMKSNCSEYNWISMQIAMGVEIKSLISMYSSTLHVLQI